MEYILEEELKSKKFVMTGREYEVLIRILCEPVSEHYQFKIAHYVGYLKGLLENNPIEILQEEQKWN